MLDAAGDLRLGGIGELELVEDVTGDLGVLVRVPQTVERAAGIVRARRRQFLVACLQAEGGGDGGKARIEWRHLHLDAAFLLLVGEGLPHAQRREVGRIGEADLVVLVVGSSRPEPDGIDRCRVGPVFALGRKLGLVRVDAGLVIGAVDAGDAIQRIVLRDRGADEAAVEDVGAADRSAVGLRRRVRLLSVHRPRLVEQIGIAGNAVIAGLAAIGVGMNREIAAAGIEQDAAFDAAIDRADGRAGLDGDARGRLRIRQRRLDRQPVALERRRRAGGQGLRDAVVGGADDAADRGRAVAQGRGPAHDFDLVGGEGIDGHEMILAEVGDAAAAGAVLDDADAVAVEAPDDRPAGGARREAGAGDAGL